MSDDLLIQGAREHNLRDVSLKLPRDKLIVFTGISGSGKSSLAFDTIYAEGQRRYVESLSSYARQFLGQMDKPDVDFIEGLSPAISIDQKSASRNPRSTVGTITEVYDYLRLLFARVGVPHDPETGEPLARQTPQQIVDRVLELPEGTRFQILAPVVRGRKGTYETLLRELADDGYVRVRVDGTLYELADIVGPNAGGKQLELARYEMHDIGVVVDRLVCRDGIERRVTDSVEAALKLTDGVVQIELVPRRPRREGASDEAAAGEAADGSSGETTAGGGAASDGTPAGQAPPKGGGASTGGAASVSDGAAAGEVEAQLLTFSQHLARPSDGKSFEELAPRNFSFNSPYGACPSCDGLGTSFEVDPELVVPDPDLSLSEGALAPWASGHSQFHERIIEATADFLEVSYYESWSNLSKEVQDVFLYGKRGKRIPVTYRNRYGRPRHYSARLEGVIPNLKRLHSETNSENRRRQIEGYMREVDCTSCGGARLRPLPLAVTIGGRNIADFCSLSIREAADALDRLELSERNRLIADQVLKELKARMRFLLDVGLDYLTLARTAGTLSGGEAQRIRLASQIGSGLVGVLYVLDEPSIGLHQRDNARLLDTLKRLRDLGNTVIVVEHDEETIRSADHVVDIGPGAGEHGGEIVCDGPPDAIAASPASLTGQYLSGLRRIPSPALRRPPGKDWLVVRGAREHNLQALDVEIPLGCFVTVTGVSGSGKSTLVNEILYPALMQKIYRSRRVPGRHSKLEGSDHIDKVINIDQQPIGRTPRSNPATYTKVFDHIRKLFSQTNESRLRGYEPGRFSFNVPGGRCEACSGDGNIRIEMHFLPDVYVPCEVCRGARYNRDTLDITFKGRNIAEVLGLSCEQGLEFFSNQPPIARHLQTLVDVGLGYIKLGQPAPTLSGGEAQRVKLASELAKRSTGHTIYLLDEPTTGLHFEDIRKLLTVLGRLVDAGNTVLIIEHNLDVIKTADWIIDLGPEGGDAGGCIVAEGTPELVSKHEESHTGRFLRPMLLC